MVELLEVILLEVREEAWRSGGMRRDIEIMNVRVPVRTYGALRRGGIRTCGHEQLL